MRPTFEETTEYAGPHLKCPACGSDYLRHVQVEVFAREEDGKTGLHVIVGNGSSLDDKGSVSIDVDMAGNPSKRRHGLVLHFECEQCPAKPIMRIAQHKGWTVVDFAPTTWTEADMQAGMCHRRHIGQPRQGLTPQI